MRFVRADIKQEWKNIKDTLSNTIHPDEPIEELYHACRSGYAHLFTVPEGYIVVQENNTIAGKSLHIWIAYGKAKFNLLKEYLPDIEELAKSINADSITFTTVRKGFERVMPEDWKQNYVEWKKKVNYGW